MQPRTVVRVACLVVLSLPLAVSKARASGIPPEDRQPRAFASSSGETLLHVLPTNRRGAGPSTLVLTQAGVERWRRNVPFTFLEAAVHDSGASVGYACPEGGPWASCMGPSPVRGVIARVSSDGDWRTVHEWVEHPRRVSVGVVDGVNLGLVRISAAYWRIALDVGRRPLRRSPLRALLPPGARRRPVVAIRRGRDRLGHVAAAGDERPARRALRCRATTRLDPALRGAGGRRELGLAGLRRGRRRRRSRLPRGRRLGRVREGALDGGGERRARGPRIGRARRAEAVDRADAARRQRVRELSATRVHRSTGPHDPARDEPAAPAGLRRERSARVRDRPRAGGPRPPRGRAGAVRRRGGHDLHRPSRRGFARRRFGGTLDRRGRRPGRVLPSVPERSRTSRASTRAGVSCEVS